MEYRGSSSGQCSVKEGLDDLKKNIQRLADFVTMGIIDNREMASNFKQLVADVRHVSYQTSCHDSCIEDHNRDLKDLMGIVDRIRGDLHKLMQMDQCSHYQDNHEEAAQQIDELSVTQPVGFPGKPK